MIASDAPAPSSEEVRKALDVLRCPASATFAEVRKKYLDLAKLHHPDVAGNAASSSASSMSAINEAYEVLQRANKAGCLPLKAHHQGGSSQQASSSSHHGNSGEYYDFQYNPYTQSSTSDSYEPMWEASPEVYEAMWQHMQEQGGMFPGSGSFYPGEFSEFGGRFPGRQSKHGDRRRRHQRGEDSHKAHPRKGSDGGPSSEGAASGTTSGGANQQAEKTCKWNDDELKALRNMYQDGKSFEFIANALGKKQADVVGEFNRWYKSQSQPNRKSHQQHRRPQQRGAPGDFYSAMPPYADVEEAFYHPDAFDEFGEPLDAHVYYDIDPFDDDDEINFAGAPRPYREGQHFMHRGGGGAGRGGGRGGGHRGTGQRHHQNRNNRRHNNPRR